MKTDTLKAVNFKRQAARINLFSWGTAQQFLSAPAVGTSIEKFKQDWQRAFGHDGL